MLTITGQIKKVLPSSTTLWRPKKGEPPVMLLEEGKKKHSVPLPPSTTTDRNKNLLSRSRGPTSQLIQKHYDNTTQKTQQHQLTFHSLVILEKTQYTTQHYTTHRHKQPSHITVFTPARRLATTTVEQPDASYTPMHRIISLPTTDSSLGQRYLPNRTAVPVHHVHLQRLHQLRLMLVQQVLLAAR